MHGELAQKSVSTAGEIDKYTNLMHILQKHDNTTDILLQCNSSHTSVDGQKEWHPENGRYIEAIEGSAGVGATVSQAKV